MLQRKQFCDFAHNKAGFYASFVIFHDNPLCASQSTIKVLFFGSAELNS